MFKLFVFLVLLSSVLAITQSGIVGVVTNNNESEQVKYQRAVNFAKENFQSRCPSVAGYQWVSAQPVESQLVSGVNYTLIVTVRKEGQSKQLRMTVSSPATKTGRASISGCSVVYH